MHYGDAYNRDYDVGTPGRMTKSDIIEAGGTPRNAHQRVGSMGVLRDSWRYR